MGGSVRGALSTAEGVGMSKSDGRSGPPSNTPRQSRVVASTLGRVIECGMPAVSVTQRKLSLTQLFYKYNYKTNLSMHDV